MSLILEALKKLERDKQVDTHGGFLVMAARPWPSPDQGRQRTAWIAGAALALLAAGIGVGVWMVRGQSTPLTTATATPRAAATAVPSAPPLPAVQAAPNALLAPPERLALPPVSSASTPPNARAPEAIANELPSSETGVPPATRERVSRPATLITSEGVATDPAAPAQAMSTPAPTPSPRFRLSAISQRDGRAIAVLNDRVVFEGDSFDGVVVTRIGEREVELKVDGKPLVVEFAF